MKAIVEISLLLRSQNAKKPELYYKLENKFKSGDKFHLLNSSDLIKLKFSFDNLTKYGTPKFHDVLASLLKEDISTMNKGQLIDLFFAGRYSNPGKTSVQR